MPPIHLPAGNRSGIYANIAGKAPYLMMWTDMDSPVGMRKHVNANMQ